LPDSRDGVVNGRSSGPLGTIRAGQAASQCAPVPVTDTNSGVRLRRSGCRHLAICRSSN
jgi:hypothetical protein